MTFKKRALVQSRSRIEGPASGWNSLNWETKVASTIGVLKPLSKFEINALRQS